jgi:hypothetical protein
MTAAKDKVDPRLLKGPEALFKTSPKAEAAGVELDYGDFWIKVTRAGATNARFKKLFDKAMKPHRRAVANDTMNNEVAERITREVWAESIVLGWGSKLGDGLIPYQGEALTFNVPNCIRLFEELPDLFIDVREQSMKLGLFQDDEQETDTGN